MKATPSRFGLGVLAFCALFFTAGCDFNAAQEAFDNLAIILELDDIETTASGQIVDASTNELISTTATLRFVGPNGDDIVDFFNDPMAEFEVEGGLASFGIENALAPAPGSPVEFTIIAKAKGYLPGTTVVTITENASENPFIITMQKIGANRAPDGATTATSSVPGSGGTVSTATQVTVSDSDSGAEIEATIPAGARLIAFDGTPLSGALTSSLSYYNSDVPSAVEAVPAGHSDAAQGQNSYVLAFATSFFVTDAEGNIATNLSTTTKRRAGVTMRITVDPNLTNPVTGAAVVAGDDLTLLYWSGEGSGTWEEITGQEMVTVQSDAEGLFVSVDAEVLGFFAFGFPIPQSLGCTVDGTYAVDTQGRTGSFQLSLTADGFSKTKVVEVGAGETLSGSFSDTFNLTESFDGQRFTFTVARGVTNASVEGVNVCSGPTQVTLPPTPASAQDIRIVVTPVCSDSGQEARVTNIPATAIFFRQVNAPAGTSWSNAGSPTWEPNDPDAPTFLVRGFLDIDEINTSVNYDFYTTYDGSRYRQANVDVGGSGETEEGRVVVGFEVDADDVCS